MSHKVPSSPVDTLRAMLTYGRPAGSRTEQQFRRRWLLGLPGVTTDPWWNIHVPVPLPDGAPSRILWSCHTDTVHRRGGRQRIVRSPAGLLTLAPGSTASCLGADDTVGVFLCHEMIRAGVPGHYIFHHGEEQGGIGSRALTDSLRADWLATSFDHAIALDRAGYGDVITAQGMGDCASDACANDIARRLRDVDRTLTYAPDPTGVYTDTAEYVHLIPECTNLSVGYGRQHSPAEWADEPFILRLRAALIAADWSGLIIERVAGIPSWSGWPTEGITSDADYDFAICPTCGSWTIKGQVCCDPRWQKF